MKVSISKIKIKITDMLVANISVELEKPIEIIKYQVYLLNEYNEAIAKENPILLPDSLPFREEQWGCMEKYQFSDVYELIEATDKHVIYHCPTKRRTLVLYFPKIKDRCLLFCRSRSKEI